MTNKFPSQKYSTAGAFVADYVSAVAIALNSVRPGEIERAVTAMKRAIQSDRLIFTCGNGGSAAIANHLTCDCSKGIATNTTLRPRVVSLSATVELVTAIANDMAYSEVFAYQLKNAARPGDVLITISSSGDSENIVRALDWAGNNGMTTIALSGFSGGRSAQMADISLHVAAQNYGVVEDVHQSLIHILAQYVRMSELPSELVQTLRF
ncbi:MAG: SIS domain-containing protein [Rhodospirillales bacterium]|nr:SIS domain-containing protein [Rhodospirillales bacterium]